MYTHKKNKNSTLQDGLHIDISEQKMYHIKNNETIHIYDVSTSVNSPSCIKNSLGTPYGKHIICQKIGGDQPSGMVFESRKPTGMLYTEHPDNNTKTLITSRILWLEGLEEGLNKGGECDTKERYIYIHGTNKEEKIGQPASIGCINMGNKDVIDLYEQVEVGTLIYIYLPEIHTLQA